MFTAFMLVNIRQFCFGPRLAVCLNIHPKQLNKDTLIIVLEPRRHPTYNRAHGTELGNVPSVGSRRGWIKSFRAVTPPSNSPRSKSGVEAGTGTHLVPFFFNKSTMVLYSCTAVQLYGGTIRAVHTAVPRYSDSGFFLAVLAI